MVVAINIGGEGGCTFTWYISRFLVSMTSQIGESYLSQGLSHDRLRRKGGLGVRRLHSLNKALLCKWNWRFTSEREAFWRQIICGKYREVEGDWCSNEARGGYGVGLWKAIRKLWDLVSCRLSFLVGNGKRIKFWKDKWCGDGPLNVFPPPYLP